MTVPTMAPGELKKALNESGWLSVEVVAAGHFRPGKPQSLAAMMTGKALIEVLRAKRSKLLPRQFVLAAAGDRVVAFRGIGIGRENDSDYYEVRISPGEKASFPRAEVSLTDLPEGVESEGATLVIGTERVPVVRQATRGDPNTDEFVELFATG